MNAQNKIIISCDKILNELNNMQNALNKASEIAKDYLKYRSEVKKLNKSDVMLSLPSDGEVQEKANLLYQTTPLSNQIHRENMEIDRQIFIDGAIWMREEVRKQGNGA